MNTTNSLERFFLLFNLMRNVDIPFTISFCSQKLNLPKEVLRDDIACMLDTPILGNIISIQRAKITFFPGEDNVYDEFYDEDFESADLSEILLYDILENTKLNLKKEILKGIHDDTELYIRDSYLMGIDNIIPLSANEYNAIKRFHPKFTDNNGKYYIKGLSKKLTPDEIENLHYIEQAIEDKCYIKVTLNNSTKKDCSEISFVPHWIFHNVEHNFIYIYGNREVVRLDEIKRITFLTDYHEPDALSPKFEYMWGVGIKENEVPTDVKIKILNVTPNLLDKIKADTKSRIHGHLDEENLIYTDTILGMDAFRRWLRGYGSSLLVLEPKSLARQMYESAKAVLANYE